MDAVPRTLLALLALVLLGWWLFGRQPLPAPAALPRASQVLAQPLQAQRGRAPVAPASGVVQREGVQVAPPRAIAPSLEGAAIDGEAALAGDGRLRIDAALRRYFDWHRAAIGEIGESGLRDWLAEHLAERLPAAAVVDALALYDSYLDYLRAADAQAAISDPQQRIAALQALRERLFGIEVAHALFADEDAWQAAALARERIRRDPALDRRQRVAALRTLEAGLPPALRPDPMPGLVDEVERLDQQFDADGRDPARRRQERSALLGAAAADRLAVLDDERARWAQRLSAYREEAARLRREWPDPAGWQAELAAWASLRYSDAELRRIAALDAEAGSGGGP